MLILKYLRENPDEVVKRLAVKNFDAKQMVENIINLDDQRRDLQQQLDNNLAAQNNLAKEIGQLYAKKLIDQANAAKGRSTELKEASKFLTSQLEQTESNLRELMLQMPNLPHPSVPVGKSALDNQVVKNGGKMPTLPPNALPHWELAKRFDLIDFELGVKITGAGFPVYKGMGAKLQRALVNFFLDCNTQAGYLEVQPPLMVNERSAFGTGQLPDKEGQMYHIVDDNFYMVPTAEVPVTNIYRDTILNAAQLPIKLTAYTPCFRREAGSYGKDVRGLNRLHQFDKVEIVQIQHPERSYQTLDLMVDHVEGILNKLQLPYRIVRLCGGDLSFTSALTYDFEVYSAAQDKWLEVSSVSNFEAFQANRLMLRFRDEGDKKPRLAHTLNGSALALPRILAAMLENYQTPDGIVIPQVLRPFCATDIIR